MGRMSRHVTSQSNGEFIRNSVDNPKNENFHVIDLRSRRIPTLFGTKV